MSQMTKLHRNLCIHCDTNKLHGPGHSREANQRVIAAISAICGKALYQGARQGHHALLHRGPQTHSHVKPLRPNYSEPAVESVAKDT